MHEVRTFLTEVLTLNEEEQSHLLGLITAKVIDSEAVHEVLSSIAQILRDSGDDSDEIANKMINFQAQLLRSKVPEDQALRIEVLDVIWKFWKSLL